MTSDAPHVEQRRGLLHQQSSQSQIWSVLGKKLPDKEVVFFSQVILLYVIIITCIINLTRGVSDSNLWTCLLSSCLGYLLPNPKLENNGGKLRGDPPQIRQDESAIPNAP